MSYTLKVIKAPSSDGKHTLVGKVYIPDGKIKGFFHTTSTLKRWKIPRKRSKNSLLIRLRKMTISAATAITIPIPRKLMITIFLLQKTDCLFDSKRGT